MIEIRRIKTGTGSLYNYSERILIKSFPPEERRDSKEMRLLTEQQNNFYHNLLFDNNRPIGLLTYWNFFSYRYVEHFAIDPSFRGKGYGIQTLTRLCQDVQTSIILEVELPENEISCRRINFYQRQGFTLRDLEYFQPPYRSGDSWLPMRLMTYATNETDEQLKPLIATIYHNVYNISEEEIRNKLNN